MKEKPKCGFSETKLLVQRPRSTRAIRHCGASNSLVVSILILIARLSSVWACLVWLGFSCRANLLSELALPEFCLLDLRGGKFQKSEGYFKVDALLLRSLQREAP